MTVFNLNDLRYAIIIKFRFKSTLKGNGNKRFNRLVEKIFQKAFNYTLQFFQNLFSSRDILMKTLRLFAILDIPGVQNNSQQGSRNIFIFKSICRNAKKNNN